MPLYTEMSVSVDTAHSLKIYQETTALASKVFVREYVLAYAGSGQVHPLCPVEHLCGFLALPELGCRCLC